MSSSAQRIRRIETSALASVQPLFERVFKSPISLPLLRWKYADGRGESWSVWDENTDRPSVHCGLAFRNVLLAGQSIRAAQLADLMADPKRVGLSRSNSPFSLLMKHVLNGLPRPHNPDGVAFGFPSDRAMRLGEHIGVFCAVDDWLSLAFGPEPSSSGPRARPWQPKHGGDLALVDSLWSRMADDLSEFALGTRDSQYVTHRYVQHPEKDYTLLIIESRWLRKPIGFAAISPGTGDYEILDLIGRQADIPDMLVALKRWLALQNGKSLTLMLTSTFAQALAPLARQSAHTQFRIMANPFNSETLLSQLRNRWWLTGGDTDYR